MGLFRLCFMIHSEQKVKKTAHENDFRVKPAGSSKCIRLSENIVIIILLPVLSHKSKIQV